MSQTVPIFIYELQMKSKLAFELLGSDYWYLGGL